MMRLKNSGRHWLTAVLLVTVLGLNSSFLVQASNLFIQFRVMTIPDSDAAQQIDQKIGSKAGILESRTDYVTSTYFCLLSPDAEYTKEDFINWFARLGYEISCYSKGIQNVDMMISPHVLKSCVEE